MGFATGTGSVLASFVSAGASIYGGIQANEEAKAEAAQYERNAQLAKIGADQEEVARRQDLNNTLSAIQAIRVGRNLDPSSPTALTLNADVTKRAEQGIGAEQLNAAGQAQAYRSYAAIARSQGSAALISGFLKAGTSVLQSGIFDAKPGGGG